MLGIDLENIVYYKDDTHYFVMTAKKQSLLKKGVILNVSQRVEVPANVILTYFEFIHMFLRRNIITGSELIYMQFL